MSFLLQGLLLGLAYVMPIGTQNIYVISSAIKDGFPKVLKTTLTVIFFDISLGFSCLFGVGILVDRLKFLKIIILIIGVIYLIYIGFNLIKKPVEEIHTKESNESMLKIIVDCFVVTWLNPQALIDGSVLLGGYRTSIPNEVLGYFLIGLASASVIWFLILSIVISLTRKVISTKVFKIINVICGTILMFLSIKLLIQLVHIL